MIIMQRRESLQMFLSCFKLHLFLLENIVHVITIIRPVLLNSLIDGYHGLYFDTEV